MKTKKTNIYTPVVLAAAAAIGLAGCANTADSATVMIDAEYASYQSTQQLVDDSDLIITGEVLSTTSELQYPEISDDPDPQRNPQAGVTLSEKDLEELAIPILVTKIRVTEVISGAVSAGEIIEVSQVGGIKDGVNYVEPDTVPLSDLEGENVVLALKAHEDAPYDLVSDKYAIMLLNEQGKISAAKSESGEISSIPLASKLEEITELVN
ncbi:MAG: hypothetical protein SPG61_00420 [Arcanobacterium sp.]|nr:hypothetical protein [Arcanobacterium sp.]